LLVVSTAHAAFDEAALDRFLLDRLYEDGIPRLSVAIVEHCRVSLVRSYGEAARGRAMRVNTPVTAASLMKIITPAPMMQLVDAGQVALDQPMQCYLPEFTLPDPGTEDAFTLRHLVPHNSVLAGSGFPEMSLPRPASIAECVTDLAGIFSPNYKLLAHLGSLDGSARRRGIKVEAQAIAVPRLH
jgi:CubicO group peptidase (beta-lactamase class C family)